jgi:hypothetical protein
MFASNIHLRTAPPPPSRPRNVIHTNLHTCSSDPFFRHLLGWSLGCSRISSKIAEVVKASAAQLLPSVILPSLQRLEVWRKCKSHNQQAEMLAGLLKENYQHTQHWIVLLKGKNRLDDTANNRGTEKKNRGRSIKQCSVGEGGT